jgi:hypothetical protein
VEKHHFGNGPYRSFRCSEQDCDAVFERPEEYTSHAMKTNHDKSLSLPEPFQQMFTENDERLKRMGRDLIESRRQFQELWGLDRSSQSQWQKVMEEVMRQLENDAPLDAPRHARDTPVSERRWLDIMVGLMENKTLGKVDYNAVSLSLTSTRRMGL